jgi:hypothetical protein
MVRNGEKGSCAQSQGPKKKPCKEMYKIFPINVPFTYEVARAEGGGGGGHLVVSKAAVPAPREWPTIWRW